MAKTDEAKRAVNALLALYNERNTVGFMEYRRVEEAMIAALKAIIEAIDEAEHG